MKTHPSILQRGSDAFLTRSASRRPAARALGTFAALWAVFGSGAMRVAAQAGPHMADFQSLSLSYSDLYGPGQVTIAALGPDETTGATAIAVTLSQARGTFSGPGFVRLVEPSGYIIAAVVTASAGAAVQDGGRAGASFLSGSLVREGAGGSWRGHGRWSAVTDPSDAGEWHAADWPAIEPSTGPLLTTSVVLDPAAGSRVSGAVTLVTLPDGETRFALQLDGLAPGAPYGVRLHAGTAAQPSASFTQLALITADAAGRANATGLVRFRGTEPVALLDIAGGGHGISVVGTAGTAVAAGGIPALQPLG